ARQDPFSLQPWALAALIWSTTVQGACPPNWLKQLGPAVKEYVEDGRMHPRDHLMVLWCYAVAEARYTDLLEASVHQVRAAVSRSRDPGGAAASELPGGNTAASRREALQREAWVWPCDQGLRETWCCFASEPKSPAEAERQAITRYPDCLQLALQEESALQTTQDAYFFEFGVIILFGLEPAAEQAVLTRFGAACQRKPYVLKEVEMDQFHFVYSATEPPHIKNDMFTINKRQANNHQVR
ncbi:DUF155 domain-containing protein, partial [Haematococcus lacustris]